MLLRLSVQLCLVKASRHTLILSLDMRKHLEKKASIFSLQCERFWGFVGSAGPRNVSGGEPGRGFPQYSNFAENSKFKVP